MTTQQRIDQQRIDQQRTDQQRTGERRTAMRAAPRRYRAAAMLAAWACLAVLASGQASSRTYDPGRRPGDTYREPGFSRDHVWLPLPNLTNGDCSLVIVRPDGSIECVDVATGALQWRHEDLREPGGRCWFLNDVERIVTNARGKDVVLINSASGEVVGRWKSDVEPAISRDQHFIGICANRTAQVIAVTDGHTETRWEAPDNTAGLMLGSDPKTVCLLGRAGEFTILGASAPCPTTKLPGDSRKAMWARYCESSGRWLVGADIPPPRGEAWFAPDNVCLVWDGRAFAEVADMGIPRQGPPWRVTGGSGAHLSTVGLLADPNQGVLIEVADVGTGRCIWQAMPPPATARPHEARLSPRGQLVALGTYDKANGKIRDYRTTVWDVRSGKLRLQVEGQLAQFRKDESAVLTESEGATGATIRIWSTEHGAQIGVDLKSETRALNVQFGSTGGYVVTAGMDRVVRVWDITKPEPIRVVPTDR